MRLFERVRFHEPGTRHRRSDRSVPGRVCTRISFFGRCNMEGLTSFLELNHLAGMKPTSRRDGRSPPSPVYPCLNGNNLSEG